MSNFPRNLNEIEQIRSRLSSPVHTISSPITNNIRIEMEKRILSVEYLNFRFSDLKLLTNQGDKTFWTI